jgi:succinate-semialdehyde dehydrogenase/glutarate-semialdehyde dehydrogenase
VEQVIASNHVKAVTFTGSNQAGNIIASLAGKYTKKTVMELGGSDPFIVFDDADLNDALHNALMSRFLNAGQSCIAAKRFIVHEDIADEFLHNFQSLVENLNLGNPLDDETFMGPMVNQEALQEIDRQVQKSIEMGANCVTGGDINMHMSSVYNPTILCNVPLNSPAWTEEVFGPVAVIRRFETDDEAIELANDTRFGLGASVWTSDMDRAAYVSKHIQAGTVAINGMVKSEPGLPFGGIKESGFGRELSDYGIYEFMNIKTISYF